MEIKLRNKGKMKRYLNQILGRTITDEEFQDSINYIIEMAEYIIEEREGETLIREGASLELEIDEEFYEVWVTYDNIIENGKRVMVIDFDYSHDDFVDSLPFEIY